MAVFYTEREAGSYLIAFAPETDGEQITASLNAYRACNGRGHIALLSKPDARSSAMLIGIERPQDTMWFLYGDEAAFMNMSSGKVFVDPLYVDSYRHLDIGFDKVIIAGHEFAVAGIVELVSELPSDYSSSTSAELRVTSTNNEPLPLYSSINGDKYEADDSVVVPLLMPAYDLIALNVPLEYLYVRFADQPSPSDYRAMIDTFAPLSADGLEPYKAARIIGFSLPVMLICLAAIALVRIPADLNRQTLEHKNGNT